VRAGPIRAGMPVTIAPRGKRGPMPQLPAGGAGTVRKHVDRMHILVDVPGAGVVSVARWRVATC
jgi:hypothetical protein